MQFVHAYMEYYEIVVKNHINPKRVQYFEDMAMILLEEGNTLLAGYLLDQAHLHSVLNKIRDMGLVLISVKKKADE